MGSAQATGQGAGQKKMVSITGHPGGLFGGGFKLQQKLWIPGLGFHTLLAFLVLRGFVSLF